MGQYYKPYSIDKNEHVYTHDFKEKFKRDDGTVVELGQGLKLMEHSYIGNPVTRAVENLLRTDWKGTRLVWAGDYADEESGLAVNLYSIAGDDSKRAPDTIQDAESPRYILNTDKKEFVALEDVKEDEDGYKIHPLPLLVCDGNGRGGGDFRGDETMVGRWARDHIEVADELPQDYERINPAFREKR